MTPLILCLIILVLAVIFCFIWLVIVAFQVSILWGILVFLFSPFTAVFFGIKYWFESKKAFLSYIISGVSLCGLVLYTLANIGFFQAIGSVYRLQQKEKVSQHEVQQVLEQFLDRIEQSALLTEQNRIKFKPFRHEAIRRLNEGLSQETVAEMIREIGTTQTGNKKDKDSEEGSGDEDMVLQDIPIQHASNFLGGEFKVETKDGNTIHGNLIKIDPNTLVLQKEIDSGTITVSLNKTDISSLQIYRSTDTAIPTHH